MFIDDIRVETTGMDSKISATIAGHHVWFQLPTEHFRGSVGNAMACLAFFPAMARHSAAESEISLPADFPVSRRLCQALPLQMNTFQTWSEGLSRFSFNFSAAESTEVAPDDRVVSSFSGGVDSLFTALTHSDEITQLVYIHGYELAYDSDPEGSGIPRLNRAAGRLGKGLIVVRTNAATFFTAQKIRRTLTSGAFKAVVAHLLGARKYYVPSTYALEPWGSHPLTDPRWSSEKVEIIYDEAKEDRIEKMRVVDEQSGMLDDVVVCFYNFEANCGRCVKCVRTMLGIELQGLNSDSFSETLTPRDIRSFKIDDTPSGPLFGRYLTLARELGQTKWVRAIAVAEAKYKLCQASKIVLSQIDDFITGGRLSRIRSRHRADTPREDRWFTITLS